MFYHEVRLRSTNLVHVKVAVDTLLLQSANYLSQDVDVGLVNL